MCGNNDRPNENTHVASGCSCFGDSLEVILKLQRRGEKIDQFNEGCDKPFLGPCPNITCYNTRPVTFYRCADGEQWTMPFTLNGTTGFSGVFRVENLDGCCVTCRVLAPNPDTSQADAFPFVSTDSFFTLNLECVGALKCLPDTFIGCTS